MGIILSSSIASLGSGYTNNSVVTVAQGANHTASIQITTVNGSGVPLSYILPEAFTLTGPSVTHGGCGYFAQNNVPTIGGGSGLKLNILTVGPGTDATHGFITSLDLSSGGSGWVLNDTGFFQQGGITVGTYKAVGVAAGVLVSLSIGSSDGVALASLTLVPGGIQPGSGGGVIIACNDFFGCSATPPGGFIIYSAALIP